MAGSRGRGRLRFSHPVRQLTVMLAVLVLVGTGAYVAFPAVSAVFLSNVWLNGAIFLVFVIGVVATFGQVVQIGASVRWIEGFAAQAAGHDALPPPRLLAPLAALLRESGPDKPIGASSARSILDSLATRIDDVREITRYIVSLLIFLGLLGTFYGLATTVPAVVETIRSLAPASDGETGMAVFDRLMSGLESQLGGMGTAFSTSLLGLAGSLVVGLLELFAGQAQNRFYRELEEWLSSFTRIGVIGGDGDSAGETTVLAAVLEQMAGQMETMQVILAEAEAERAQLDARLAALTGALERVAQRLETDGGVTDADRIVRAIERLGDSAPAAGSEGDARARLRGIEVQLARILEELVAGRQETVADLRADIAALTTAVRQTSRSPAPAAPVRPLGRGEG